MLNFRSASVRIAESSRAVEECFEILYGNCAPDETALWIVNAGIGHRLNKIADAIHSRVPAASVLGSSCGGVIGREGVGESVTHMGVMVVDGPTEEMAWAAADDFHAEGAFEKGLDLAEKLKEKLPAPKVIYLLTPGLDSCNDELLKAFDEVFGNTLIFGGASSDNDKALATSQYIGDRASPCGIWAAGFADPSLKAAARATHGFTAYGDPMVATKVRDNKILEFDGLPAWSAYTRYLGNIAARNMKTVSIMGGLAAKLPPELAKASGNSCILRAGMPVDEKGAIRLAVSAKEGESWYMTARDEDLIFSELQKTLALLREDMAKNSSGDEIHPVAVFQADCMLRGRTLFNRVMKDEIIETVQHAFLNDGEIPPWLGIYGFGEFCPLGDRNFFHTYTTALLILYR
ncbi:MAG: FIST C-terminal domain-containing protein [Synergistaceae bacterium]|jgi:hypothetical protein|nr:FIST C-terminal domain-containing protein [Synergistaceae bacterium]